MYIKHLHRDLISKIYFTFFLSIRTSRTTWIENHFWPFMIRIIHNDGIIVITVVPSTRSVICSIKRKTPTITVQTTRQMIASHTHVCILLHVSFIPHEQTCEPTAYERTRRSAKIFASARLVVSRDVQTLADVCYGFCCADAIIIITTVS